ncbi:uncharacterized protein LOC135091852 [Scylla paramamosain]|uniref:uncharacterized protein LOC135091852 n=1 Tax=Scylla paramamosain TaxID=85552 RepID=UPI00308302BD
MRNEYMNILRSQTVDCQHASVPRERTLYGLTAPLPTQSFSSHGWLAGGRSGIVRSNTLALVKVSLSHWKKQSLARCAEAGRTGPLLHLYPAPTPLPSQISL